MGNEAIKEIGAACQVSSSRPLQAIGAFPKVHVMTLPRFLCGAFVVPTARGRRKSSAEAGLRCHDGL